MERDTLISKEIDYKVRAHNMEEAFKLTNVTASALAKRMKELENENEELRNYHLYISKRNGDLVIKRRDAPPTPKEALRIQAYCVPSKFIISFCYIPENDQTTLVTQGGERVEEKWYYHSSSTRSPPYGPRCVLESIALPCKHAIEVP